MRHVALGLYTYAEFAASVATFLPVMGSAWLLHRGDPTQRTPGRWMRRLGRVTSAMTPLWKFSIAGDAPPDIAHRPYVVIANHESNANPFLLSWLPWDMRWVAKDELFRIPVMGLAFKFSGDIPLVRGEGDSVRSTMAECVRALEGGISVMMFPEGTRSRTGELLPFRDGAFRLAIETGVPILPVALAGTRDCLPKGSRWLGRARAVAKVLAPIETRGLGDDDIAALRERARDAIDAALPEVRRMAGVKPPPAS